MDYNPFSRECVYNPFPVYRYLRDEQPVYVNEAMGFYALSRFDDVMRSLLDTNTFKSSHGVTLEGIDAGMDLVMNKDDREHNVHRAIVSRAFTPRAISGLEPKIRAAARDLLDRVDGCDGFDVVDDFSLRIPLAIISEMLGLPEDVRPQVQELSSRATAATEASEDPHASDDALLAMADLYALLQRVVTEAASAPDDDVLGRLLEARYVDHDGVERSLSHDTIVTRVIELAIAGHETVAKQIGNGVVALRWYPEQRAELAANPELLTNAVEEMLRWDPASHYVARFIEEPVTLHGTTIPANTRVLLLTASANHDERVFAEPELFDIHRRIDRHVGFAFGPHLCLGAALARLETRVAIEELLARYPDYELSGPVERYYSGNVRGLSKLPILLSSAA